MEKIKLCQVKECGQPAAWEIPNYFTKGGQAAKDLRTRSRLECAEHGEESRAINPFQDWKRCA